MTLDTTATSNLNTQALHNLLFEDSSSRELENMKTKEFDFTDLWNKLATVNNIKGNLPTTTDSSLQDTSLSGLFLDESPIMDTPFLDNSCMNTPFTPASLFTPNLDQFQNSPYIQPSTHCDSTTTHLSDPTNDVQVANYLKNDIPWQNPIHVSTIDLFPQVSTDNQFLNSFNGDPNQLLLNTSDNTVASSSEESTDFLFPPLPSDNQQTTITSLNEQQEQEQQNSFNSQEFDINALFGDCFDDVFFGITQQDEQQQQQQQQNKHKTSSSIPNKVIKHTKESFISIKDNTLVIKKKKVDQNERRFKCHICQAMFNRRYNLGTHIKTHDKNRNKEFTCSICQKSFDRKHDMTRHVATVHKGERAFRCKYCTSSFSRKDVLARHCMQKHNDVH